MNLKIREFKISLANFISASDLPIEVKSIILIDLARQAQALADEQIKKEAIERDEAKKSEAAKQESEG